MGKRTKCVHKTRGSGNLDEPLTLRRKNFRRSLYPAPFLLAARTAFVARTGPRFELTVSVGRPMLLMTACANVHNSPTQRLLVSAWMFMVDTCGFMGSAAGGMILKSVQKC